MLEKPSVAIPGWMLREIEERRPKGSNRSEYIRQSLSRRFEQEDSDDWELPTGEFELRADADDADQPADTDGGVSNPVQH